MPRISLISSRLAANAGIRQVEVIGHANGAGLAVDAAITGWWGEVLKVLATTHGHSRDYGRLYALLTHLPKVARGPLTERLRAIAAWGHTATVRATAGELPLPVLQAANVRRRNGRSTAESRLTEAGLLTLFPGGFEDEAEPLREPSTLTPNQARDLFLDLLFPPPDAREVNDVVFSWDWQDRLESETRLGNPAMLAAIIATGMSQGKSQQELARALLPEVQGVRSSARRIARTEGLRVAHEVQMRAWDGMGDMIVGYSVLPVLDQASRPWHAHRMGQIYYKSPKPGQKGLSQMPRPPMEPEDPAERPAGTPRIAYNCRCTLTPVLVPAHDIEDDPASAAVFTDAADRVVPDPATYHDWFEAAPEYKRRTAVGARRYKAVKDLLGSAEPTWAHFLDPDTGDLLTRKQLETESAKRRAERVEKVNAIIAARRELARRIAVFGFEPTEKTPADQLLLARLENSS